MAVKMAAAMVVLMDYEKVVRWVGLMVVLMAEWMVGPSGGVKAGWKAESTAEMRAARMVERMAVLKVVR